MEVKKPQTSKTEIIMKTRIIAVFFSAVLLFAGSVKGQVNPLPGAENGRMERLHQGRPGGLSQNRESIFTNEQNEAVKAIRMKSLKELKPLKDKLREITAHHITLTTADKPDMLAINSSIDKIGETKTAIAKVMEKQHQEIRGLLTEEQRIKFDQMKSGMMERGQNHPIGQPFMRGSAPGRK
jgi:Spy/CpxP family protein refolding chaperone